METDSSGVNQCSMYSYKVRL